MTTVERFSQEKGQWPDRARELGLTYDPGSWRRSPTLQGTRRGLDVKVEWEFVVSGGRTIETTRYKVSEVSRNVRIRTRWVPRKPRKDQILTGDAALDERFTIEGEARLRSIVEGSVFREVLGSLGGADVTVGDGTVTLEISESLELNEVCRMLEAALSLGKLLCLDSKGDK